MSSSSSVSSRAIKYRNRNDGLNDNTHQSVGLNNRVGRRGGNNYNFYGNNTQVCVNNTRDVNNFRDLEDTDDLQDGHDGDSYNFHGDFNQVGPNNNIIQDHNNLKGLTDEVHELGEQVKENKIDIADLSDNVEDQGREIKALKDIIRVSQSKESSRSRKQSITIGIQGPDWRNVMEPLTVDPNITFGDLEELLNKRLNRTDVFIYSIGRGRGHKRNWFEFKSHKTLEFQNVKDGHIIHINYRNIGRS